jgi:DNA-binding transcriptional ArsR family regulator
MPSKPRRPPDRPRPTPEERHYAALLAALGHPVRLAILRHVLRAHPDGLVVGEILQRVAIPGSTLTHHLDALRRAGVVEAERESQWIRYRASVSELRGLLAFLNAECCAETGVVPASAIRASLRR